MRAEIITIMSEVETRDYVFGFIQPGPGSGTFQFLFSESGGGDMEGEEL